MMSRWDRIQSSACLGDGLPTCPLRACASMHAAAACALVRCPLPHQDEACMTSLVMVYSEKLNCDHTKAAAPNHKGGGHHDGEHPYPE